MENPVLDRDLIRAEADSIAKVLKEIGIEATVAHAGGRWVVHGLIPKTEKSFTLVSFRETNDIRFALHQAAVDRIMEMFK